MEIDDLLVIKLIKEEPICYSHSIRDIIEDYKYLSKNNKVIITYIIGARSVTESVDSIEPDEFSSDIIFIIITYSV